MLAKKNRIGEKRRIEELAKKGHEYRTPHFTFRFLPKSAPPVFAITVSQKIAPRAVDRNQLRRQVAEAIRTNLSFLKKNVGVLVIGRPKIRELDYAGITREITQFFNQFNSDAK